MEVNNLHRVIAIFDFPIIQAPNRDLKLNKEMWTKSLFGAGSCARSERETLREL
jgi:hypothetical protein